MCLPCKARAEDAVCVSVIFKQFILNAFICRILQFFRNSHSYKPAWSAPPKRMIYATVILKRFSLFRFIPFLRIKGRFGSFICYNKIKPSIDTPTNAFPTEKFSISPKKNFFYTTWQLLLSAFDKLSDFITAHANPFSKLASKIFSCFIYKTYNRSISFFAPIPGIIPFAASFLAAI